MATIQSSIQLMDGMSKPLASIVSAINLTISALDKVNGTNVNINTSELTGARAEIIKAGADLKRIENDIAENIRKNEEAQNDFNRSLRNGASNADNLYSKIKRFVGIYAGVQGLKNSFNLSDTLTQNSARLSLTLENYNSPDKQITGSNISQAPVNLNLPKFQNMIFESAQRSRGNYLATSDSIGKMGLMAGDVFSSGQEIISFMELINKQFKIAGTNAAGIDAAMLQLTQAMGSGILRGEEYNSILEQAPVIIQNIAKYLDIPKGQLKNMAAEGKITADIVKNAMFAAATDINAKFEAIPKTFTDAVTNMQNNILKQFTPISKKLNTFVNSTGFEIFTNAVIKGMGAVINVTLFGLDLIGKVGQFVYDNWRIIGPAIGAVTTAILVYKSAMILANIELMKNNILQGKNTLGAVIMGVKNFYLATSAFVATAATQGLNAALMASPLGIVAGGLALVVGGLYAGVAAFNALTGKTVSATGIITGSIAALVGSVLNYGVFLWNNLVSVAEAFVNIWKHPIYSVKKLFWDLVISILDIFDNFSGIVDTIAGTDYSKKIKDYRTSIQADLDIAKPKDYIDSNLKINPFNTGNMMKTTYEKTAEVGNIFKNETAVDMTESNDYLKGILNNTASMSEGLDLTTEEIKYMRDAAEMEVINKFTTAEIKMEVQNSNMISNNMDIHDVIDEFTNYLQEKMQMTAEGVHS